MAFNVDARIPKIGLEKAKESSGQEDVDFYSYILSARVVLGDVQRYDPLVPCASAIC